MEIEELMSSGMIHNVRDELKISTRTGSAGVVRGQKIPGWTTPKIFVGQGEGPLERRLEGKN